MQRYISRLLYVLPAKKVSLIILLLLFLLASTIEVFGIGIVGPFLALASQPELIHQNFWLDRSFQVLSLESNNQFIVLIGVLVIIAFCIKSLVSWFVQVYIFQFSIKQQKNIAIKLFGEYLLAPYIFHTKTNSADIIYNILEVFNEISTNILIPFFTSISNSIIAVSIFILLCKTNLTVVIVVLATLLPFIVLFNYFKDRIQKWGKEARLAKAEMIGIINHGLGSIKETRIIGCESYFQSQMIDKVQMFSKAKNDFFAFKVAPRYIVETVIMACLVGIVTTFLSLNHSIDKLIPVLGVFSLASLRMIPIISNSMNGISTLRNSTYILYRLYSTLKELEAAQVNLTSQNIKNSRLDECSKYESKYKQEIAFKQRIDLDRITYCYPNTSENAISEISLTIHKGQSIALIGKSGAGKTTLVDIILGLITPQHGDIQVDSKSIYSDLRAWQNLIGYIPQSIFLIDDTIERNIAFGIPDHLIDEQRFHKAIQAAQLTEVIENLPNGVKTIVGERGVLLSGGQRQRVGIARALYHEREILVLDEATAALDNETESLVNDAIKSLSRTKTMIIIAHRLTTVKHCDRIYLLENGRVVKSGSYQEVVLEDAKTS